MTTDELLAAMESEAEAYADGPVDDIITIDAEARTINIPASEVLFGVKSDKDVERKHFRCPKIVGDNIDLSAHKIYISYIASDAKGLLFTGDNGLYYCEDMAVDGDYITFSWLLSGNVFANPGFIAFKVLATYMDGENLKTRWNTTPAVGTVLMTVPDGQEIAEQYPDIITQLLDRMESVENSVTPEAIQGYVNTYLEDNPSSGMTAEEKEQLTKNANDIKKLSDDKVDKPLEDGTEGQVLAKDADGNIVWKDAIAEIEDGAVTISKLAPDVLNLLSSSGGSDAGSDMLKGSLPYTINESGLYIIADSDTSVIVSSDDSQLINFTDGITISKSTNGSNLDTYNKVNLSVVSENCINIETQDASTNMSAHLNMADGTLVAGETYTLFGRIEKVVDTGKVEMAYVRMLGSSVQLNLGTEIAAKSFIADDSGTWGDAYVSAAKTSTTSAGDNYNFYLYLYQGELTDMPSGNATLPITAGEKYSTDGYLGKTLTGNNADIAVYVYKTNTDNADVETDTSGVIFFGDSILDFSGVPALYADRTGKSVIDCAVGGTRMSGSRDSANEYYPYDMTNIADAIASGDFSAQINGGKNSQFSTLATAQISNYKAIVLEFGTNDFTAGVPFNGDEVTTIEGAIKFILTTILTAYPNMRIVVLSTLQYVTLGSGNESGVPTHVDGTVWQMNEVIRTVCESDDYCVPWVDIYHAFGQNGLTRGTLTSDGAHLMSPNGVNRYTDILTAKLNSLGI